MRSVSKAFSSTASILAYSGLGAGFGAVTCAAGAALIGPAVPPIAAGAIVIGSSFGMVKAVHILFEKTSCNQAPLEIQVVTGLATTPITLLGASAIATAIGFPITFKAAVLTWLATWLTGLSIALSFALPVVLIAAIPVALFALVYFNQRNTPQHIQQEA